MFQMYSVLGSEGIFTELRYNDNTSLSVEYP